jgi:hypothetical protein
MVRPRADEHGSDKGYHQHVRDKTLPCPGCLNAHAATATRNRDRGRCARGLGWPLESPGLPLPGK